MQENSSAPKHVPEYLYHIFVRYILGGLDAQNQTAVAFFRYERTKKVNFLILKYDK